MGNLDPFPPILPQTRERGVVDQRKTQLFTHGFLVGHSYIASNASDPHPRGTHAAMGWEWVNKQYCGQDIPGVIVVK